MQNIIDLLQRKQLIWKGSEQNIPLINQPSYFSEWDQHLEGFPKMGLMEIQSEFGIGELRLLTPMLQSTTQDRSLVLINPPALPCAHYFETEGIAPHNVLVIDSTKHDLWAAEQCLKSGSCACVCLWHPQLEVHQARRLQIAAEKGRALNVHFNLDRQNSASLPIPLSVQLNATESGMTVDVIKRRGGWQQQAFSVDLSHRWPQLCTQKPLHQVIPFPLHKRQHA
ncbi:translesion DNA synthesis-associated protein ImuA [Vibrio neonatus]|uniref:translesion DNA synthesis-associated protein ImuA n=1 Tax=Vibrio neonatus TaxID=278860 RepID=UPI0021C2CA0C|nr:translesion DNA synthesis-associated protein ImuA [Vibrio neonatus]